jgi:hypothetical protein
VYLDVQRKSREMKEREREYFTVYSYIYIDLTSLPSICSTGYAQNIKF